MDFDYYDENLIKRFISIESIDVLKAEEYVNKYSILENRKYIPDTGRLIKIRWYGAVVQKETYGGNAFFELEFVAIKENFREYDKEFPIFIRIYCDYPEDELNDNQYYLSNSEESAKYNLRYIRYVEIDDGRVFKGYGEDKEQFIDITRFIKFRLLREYLKHTREVDEIISSSIKDTIPEHQNFDELDAFGLKDEWKNCPNCDESPCQCSDPF